MKILKQGLIIVLTLTVLLCATTVFGAYNVEEFGIDNINVPEDFISCTKNQCDAELEEIIVQNGFTGLSDWVQRVMAPDGIYLYSCNKKDLTKCMYLMCKEVKISKTKDGLVEHKLASDYNMYKSEADKAWLLDEIKRAATTDTAAWALQDGKTPFVEYTATDGSNIIHAYRTIYGGTEITLQFSSSKNFTQKEKDMHLSILSSLKISKDVDYTEINHKISQARIKKLEEETHSGENTKLLRYIISASVAFVIFFSVYFAIRSQNKKRRSSVVIVDKTKDNDN